MSTLFYQMVEPTPMFPAVPRERGSKQEVSPDIQIEQLSRNTPRLYSIQKESEDLNRRGRNEQETVAEGPTEMRPEDLFGDYIGEDARIVWPWKSTRGKRQ